MTEAGPLAQAEWFGRLARDAFARGERALMEGDPQAALRWFTRAHRIAPQDPAASMALAAAMLRLGDPGAAALFSEVAEQADACEAWLGAAASHHAQGHHGAAAAMMRRALSSHAIPSTAGVDDLLTAIARAAGLPGWCCLSETFGLRHRLIGQREAEVAVTADGEAFHGAVPGVATALAVTAGGRHLLGSPIRPAMVRRVEGFVETRDGGIAGWVWHPASPGTAPMLIVRARDGRRRLRITAQADAPAVAGVLARHRAFRVPAEALADFARPLRVGPPSGPDLLGSPLDPTAAATLHAGGVERHRERGLAASRRAPSEPAQPLQAAPSVAPRPAAPVEPTRPKHARAPHPPPPAGAAMPPRRAVIVIPAYRDAALTLACIDAVAATTARDTRIVVVDDATPEPDLADALDRLRAARRIRLVRHRANRGFPASANAGIRAALALPGECDVVLLNSDTRTTPGWLDRLRAATHAAPDVGTATPLSNDASILSYPHPDAPVPMPSPRDALRLARLAARANGAATVDIPTAVGFCMYVRRECLAATGLLREDVFAQGYGEENDFCLRARRLGWRHVAVPGAYVAHAGGRSFGAARAHLMRRNLDVMERLHPGYHAAIAAFVARDPLAAARRRLDLLRFAAGGTDAGAVVLVTHDSGGGVQRAVRARADAIRAEGRRPIVLRPVLDRAGAEDERRYRPGLCAVGEAASEAAPGDAWPNLIYRLPDERPALLDLLGAARVARVETHHLLGHNPWLLDLAAALGVPCDVHVHDYAWFCQRISLVNDARRYCGEPVDPAVCDACVAAGGSRIEEAIPTAALRARSARHLAAARSVVVPSHDTAARIRRHFPQARPLVRPHEADAACRAPKAASRSSGERLVCVIGGIGVEKGYDVLLACARDAQARRLPLAFTVVGHTIDDRALFDTGRVFVTGAYREAEGVSLIEAQGADLAFLPSIWPETWCYTLGLAWAAGLRAVAFDIGAPAERIRRTGRGAVLPLGLPPISINDALLAVLAVAGDECATHRVSS